MCVCNPAKRMNTHQIMEMEYFNSIRLGELEEQKIEEQKLQEQKIEEQKLAEQKF